MRRADREKGDDASAAARSSKAIELALPAESPLRAASADLILAELTNTDQVEQAGHLAQLTKDVPFQTMLLLRQADLYAARSNAVAAADVGWTLFETRQLPADRFDWLLERLRNARDDRKLIRADRRQTAPGYGSEPDSDRSAGDRLRRGGPFGRLAASSQQRTRRETVVDHSTVASRKKTICGSKMKESRGDQERHEKHEITKVRIRRRRKA